MTIEVMTSDQLKVAAYDQIVAIENAQNNLKIINAEITKRAQEPLKRDEVKKA